jgi:hypothetical protein
MDLYSGNLDDLRIGDVEDFLAVGAPLDQRPPEGLRIDYKLKEPSDLCDTVASLANTSGGLIFIGVESKRTKHNFPISLPGEEFPGGDVKARIAGKIVSQVTPRPEFSVGVAPLSGHQRVVVVVRVPAGIWPPYEFTSSNTIRIPVRIQDTNRQATLREIEHLIERRSTFSQSTEERLANFASRPLNPAFITDVGTGPQLHAAQAFHTWTVRPRLGMRARLDRAFDQAVRTEVRRDFNDSSAGRFYPPLMTGFSHLLRWQIRIDSSQFGILSCARNFEFSADGSLRYSEKMDRHENGSESVSDLFIQSLNFLRFASNYYHSRGNWRSFSVSHRIDCSSRLKLFPNFPDDHGRYYSTNSIIFGGEAYGQAQGSSMAMREMDGLTESQSRDLVIEFMLGHLRELCQANVDSEALASVISALPSLAFFPMF